MYEDSAKKPGAHGSEWARRRKESGAGGPGLRRFGPVWLAFLVVGVLGLFYVLDSNDEAPIAAPVPVYTPEPALETTPTATPTIAETPTPTPAGGGPRFRIAVWTDARQRWQFSDLEVEASGYTEGQAIPFLLQIDNAKPGSLYRINLQYNCRSDGAATFDFLTGYDRDVGSEPSLVLVGPADATISIPDDPAIGFDDEEREGSRLLRLWGGSFDSVIAAAAPDASCSEDKFIGISIRARAPTLDLMWGSHLGSSADWGEGQGAASHDSPFEIEVIVPGVAPESLKLGIAPGAVSP